MSFRAAVIVPAYKCRKQILRTIKDLALYENLDVLVVDDACPEGTGRLVELEFSDSARVRVIFNDKNRGVGGAFVAGLRHVALSEYDAICKFDGDGQMRADELLHAVHVLLANNVDHVKGNRFLELSEIRKMPLHRILGNSLMSLLSKFSSGYWRVNDPTNGMFATKPKVFEFLDESKFEERFFFESDLLYHLRLAGVRIVEIQMSTIYGDEISNISAWRVFPQFMYKHLRNSFRRFWAENFLRGWTLLTFQVPLALIFMLVGLIQTVNISLSSSSGTLATPGQVSVAIIGLVLGLQLTLSAIGQDMSSEPSSSAGVFNLRRE